MSADWLLSRRCHNQSQVPCGDCSSQCPYFPLPGWSTGDKRDRKDVLEIVTMSDNVHSLTRRSKTYFKGQEKRGNLPSFSPLSLSPPLPPPTFYVVYVFICMCTCMFMCIHVCVYMCTLMCMNMCLCSYVWRLDADFLFCFHLNF